MIREEREYLENKLQHGTSRPATYLISLQTLPSLASLPSQPWLPIDSILARMARFTRNPRFAHEADLSLLTRGAGGSLQYSGGEISRHGGQQASVSTPTFLSWPAIITWVRQEKSQD